MVYAMRSDRPMITSKPLKMKRKKNGRHEQIREFLNSHDVTMQKNASGELVPVIEVKKSGF